MPALNVRPDATSLPPLRLVPSVAERRGAMPNRVAYALAASVIGLRRRASSWS